MTRAEIDNTKRVHQGSKTANVLIVDNDPEAVRSMLEIFARKGIRGIIANDKKAAVDFLDKDNCDLVFTSDKISQGSDPQCSFELLRKIRTNSPELPVIMIAKAERQITQDRQRTIDTVVNAI